jgi:hypothetical protein
MHLVGGVEVHRLRLDRHRSNASDETSARRLIRAGSDEILADAHAEFGSVAIGFRRRLVETERT